MNRPKYKVLYLDEKAKVELIFRLCPKARELYELHKKIVEAHAIDLEQAFMF